ncbi:MAG TPA: hypothetical protein DEA08_23225 [Planctomycetes bacterium]|nr:hypothetical protein [Planctomycetota bacterium]
MAKTRTKETKKTTSKRGGRRPGAGRPREIQGESPIVNLGIRISEEQAQALDEIAEAEGLRGRATAVRWLIEEWRERSSRAPA